MAVCKLALYVPRLVRSLGRLSDQHHTEHEIFRMAAQPKLGGVPYLERNKSVVRKRKKRNERGKRTKYAQSSETKSAFQWE